MLKSILLPKVVLTLHCLNTFFYQSQKFCKFSAFSLEFQNIFSITGTIFSHSSRSEHFGNKIPFINPCVLRSSMCSLSDQSMVLSFYCPYISAFSWSFSSDAQGLKHPSNCRRTFSLMWRFVLIFCAFQTTAKAWAYKQSQPKKNYIFFSRVTFDFLDRYDLIKYC
jgi:hypothetical protein